MTLAKEGISKIAIIMTFGFLEFAKMPFGLRKVT